ncbi:MAG: SAM-dependent methyltransferase, partial [Pacificimonas sp.]
DRTIRYGSPAAMLRDLRGMGETNILGARGRTPLTRHAVHTLSAAVSALAGEDGRIPVKLELIFLTGRGP